MNMITSNLIKSLEDNKLYVSVHSFETCEQNRQKYTVQTNYSISIIYQFYLFFLFKLFKVSVKLGQKNWIVERRYNEFDKLNTEVSCKILLKS